MNYKEQSWYELPDGWESFFNQMWNDIKNLVDEDFRFLQVKEKFGQLRCYTSGESEEVRNIIDKYEYISQFICINCGKPAKYETNGYIAPFCDKCLVHKLGCQEIEFDPIMKVTRWSTKGTEHYEYNVSDIWERYNNEYSSLGN